MKLAILVLALAGCSVSRKSEQFACTTSVECKDGRTCDRGYCVEQAACPSPCNSCDMSSMTCNINCSSGSCGGVHCPDGYNCTIMCTGNNACNSVDCSDGTSCAISCIGNQACRHVDCGNARCMITCGANGCNNVDCSSSCQCDVVCPSGNCNTSCPSSTGGTLCTQNGSDDTACSSAMPGCAHC